MPLLPAWHRRGNMVVVLCNSMAFSLRLEERHRRRLKHVKAQFTAKEEQCNCMHDDEGRVRWMLCGSTVDENDRDDEW